MNEQTMFITRMEYFLGTPIGFNAQSENTLIPWVHYSGKIDDTDALDQFQLDYSSNIAQYNYACSWAANGSYTLGEGGEDALHGLDGTFFADQETYRWKTAFKSADVPSIIQIDRISANGTTILDTTAAFAFVTDGEPLWPGMLGTLDLGNVPTFPMFNVTTGAILVCDPNITISPAEVVLDGRILNPNLRSGGKDVGNFDHEAAARVLSLALHSATDSTSVTANSTPNVINWSSLNLFIMNLTSESVPVHRGPLEPLPLNIINSRLDRFIQSAAKTYLSGYWDNSTDGTTITSFSSSPANATKRIPVAGITASSRFLIALTAVDGAIVIILATLLWMLWQTQVIYLFDLDGLRKTIFEGHHCAPDVGKC
ncbi:hypothetical protein P691DRAFT_805252 [Macrolepiota fuliginosa MF-IS2]|uniref:Uncharacterized protein n=1 Tax=Macrolepiota fuliginosa MF-IS2 TaxID=1400762 RepID=A0A9P6C1N4_9AGAR|nr:hypothetical protein P691DRAFT_805252 [Macrolepiota fuliginosa MF-IS2]